MTFIFFMGLCITRRRILLWALTVFGRSWEQWRKIWKRLLWNVVIDLYNDVRVQILIWFQFFMLFTKAHLQTFNAFNPLRTKTTLYLFLRGNKSLLYHQIGNRNLFIFITIQWNLMFCVDKIKYEHLAILSNLKSCQFAPRIVIFNLCICCQFEDSQIMSPKIILWAIATFNCTDKWGLTFCSLFFSFFWYIIQKF